MAPVGCATLSPGEEGGGHFPGDEDGWPLHRLGRVNLSFAAHARNRVSCNSLNACGFLVISMSTRPMLALGERANLCCERRPVLGTIR